MRSKPFLIVTIVGALLGLLFAAVSTYDFAQHLDRQVHGVHCSFIPGLGGTDVSGTSGCQVAMMSPYSSVFRSAVWGGLPIALPAMGVFAFLAFFAAEILFSGRGGSREATGLLAFATALPLATSILMGLISVLELGSVCKLCAGIYVASIAVFVGGVGAWRRAGPTRLTRLYDDDEDLYAEGPTALDGDAADTDTPSAPDDDPLDDDEDLFPVGRPGMVTGGYLAGVIALGVVCVALPAVAYVSASPSHAEFVANCGTLERRKDVYEVMVPVGDRSGGPSAIEILDPLCPACRAFEQRLVESGFDAKIDRKVLLFPLDDTCNWMVDSAIHPGACTISEAVLCAGDDADAVLAWAFENQEAILEASAENPKAARKMVLEAFGSLERCVGSAKARALLNKSLRWAVRNRLPVMTPQLYLEGVKLCDEDLDLGLDWSFGRMLEMHAAGTLPIPEDRPEPPRFVPPPKVEEDDPAAAPTEDTP